MRKASRLGWITACLRLAGRFGPREKKYFMDHFGVSGPTVSRDQAEIVARLLAAEGSAVQAQAGKIETLDPSSLPDFPDLDQPSVDEWLKVMLGSRHVTMTGRERVLPSHDTIRALVRSLEDRRAVFVRYVSRRTGEPTWRPLSPHAVVSIAGRYHARCYDHMKGRYGDFVLTRIIGTTFDRTDTPRYVDERRDIDWQKMVVVQVSLIDGEPQLIGRLDYGLDESGFRIIRIRKALAPYIIDRRGAGFEDQVRTEIIG